MNNKQLKVYNSLIKHSSGYGSASLGMIKTNAVFFQAYNGVRLTHQEEEQLINEFIEKSGVVIV